MDADGLQSIPLTLLHEKVLLPCQARPCGQIIGGGDAALTSLLVDGHVTTFGTW
jgi:hypothetical protein